MYPQWVMDIATLAERVDARVEYCVQPELYGAKVLWPGLPCTSRTVEEDAVGNTDHPHFIGKAMIGVVELRDPPPDREPYEWVLTLACGRLCAISKKQMRRLIATDLQGRRGARARHDVVTRAVGRKGQERDIPYMPAWCHSPKSSKTRELDPFPTPTAPEPEPEMADGIMAVRERNARMYEMHIDECAPLRIPDEQHPTKKRKLSGEQPAAKQGAPAQQPAAEPANHRAAETRAGVACAADPDAPSEDALKYIGRCIAAAERKLKGGGEGFARGTCGSSVVAKHGAEADKLVDELVQFLYYYDRYFRHTDKAHAHPVLGRDAAPTNNDPTEFVRTPQFGSALKLFMEVFVAARAVQ